MIAAVPAISSAAPLGPSQPGKPNISRRVLELDGLRAVAIALVLGCHYQGFAKLAGGLPQLGWVGVDIFFALSGYLITSILLGLRIRQTPYTTFYSRRFIRILPPYLAIVLPLLVFGRYDGWLTFKIARNQFLFLQAYMSEPIRPVIAALRHPAHLRSHLVSLTALAHHLPPSLNGQPPQLSAVFPTYWSLSIEEWFYVLWAPVVLRLPRRWIVAAGVLICLLEPFLRWLSGSELSYFGLLFRFDALIYGGFLALAMERWRKTEPAKLAGALSLLFWLSLAAIAVILYRLHPFAGREVRSSALLLVFGLPALATASSAAVGLFTLRANSAWWPARLLRSRPFQFIGTVSYTMYLVHIVAETIVAHAVHPLGLAGDSVWVAIAACLVTVLLAQLSWRFLEDPLLQWKDRRFPNTPHPTEPTGAWTAPVHAVPAATPAAQ